MRRSTATLGVLLGVSLFVNSILLLRSAREQDSPRSSISRRGESVGREGEASGSLQEQLNGERKRNEDLRSRIERLETDKSVLAQGESAGHFDPVSQFRDKIHRLRQLPNPASGTPEADLEVSAIETDFQRFLLGRGRNPHAYSEALRAYYEEALKGGPSALTPEQARALAGLMGDMEKDLTRIQETSGVAHVIRELEVESATRVKLKGLLSEEQVTFLEEGLLSNVVAGNNYSRSAFVRDQGVENVTSIWIQSFGLEENQQAAAQGAAQIFVAAMNRIDRQTPGNGSGLAYELTPEGYDYRIRALREQMTALRILEQSLTPEQRERFKNATVQEFIFVDPNPRPQFVPAQQDR